jgi:hypothetical protein
MFEIGSKKFVQLIALICFIGVTMLILLSKGTYDPGDGVQHYLIAKYALKHPLLLLDHWGKPIYTLLCMPFAQIGFVGSNIYNLICNTSTSFLAYEIAKKMGIKNAWLAFILVFFSPLFFITTFSGLTEPTFALILTASVLLMLNAKYTFGALLISFLPFARTEGFFILPLFALFLILHKQWKAAILTGFATVLYSLIGLFVLNDVLWIFHQNPYKGAIDIYGKGPLMHFVAANDRLFGLPLVILFIVGCISLIIGKTEKNSAFKAFILLVIGSFVVYFLMHSIFWWKGLFGSLGLHRVMAAVAPLFSIVALLGYNLTVHFLSEKVQLQKIISSIIIMAVIIYPFKQYRPPLKPDAEMQVLINTSEWIKANGISSNQKVYCMFPMLAMLLNVDPFNPNKYISTCMLKYPDFSHALKPGDLILWDAHFGNECGFLPEEIAQLPHVKKLANFKQAKDAKETFNVVVFKVEKSN